MFIASIFLRVVLMEVIVCSHLGVYSCECGIPTTCYDCSTNFWTQGGIPDHHCRVWTCYLGEYSNSAKVLKVFV